MKTKNIFKALAMAMLMPTILLPTACSSEDDYVNNTENTIKKGYELPVTINVTREDATTTRATYNSTTKKLEFSTGDKLYVVGESGSVAGVFAGTLTWVSEGTFSGTIYTEYEYSGTADELFEAGNGDLVVELLPAGYESYGYFVLNNPETYTACVSRDFSKAFALTKATAVEQFSEEYAETYDHGIALSPRNAILNFTITGLTANTSVVVYFTSSTANISGSVTTDASGNATFAVGLIAGTSSASIGLTVGGKAVALNLNGANERTLAAGKIYNITRSALPAVTLAGKFTINDGDTQVYFSQGNLQATYNGSAWSWAFAANQWDYIGNAAGNTSVNGNGTVSANGTVDLFGWVGESNTTWTGAAQYGISNSSTTNSTDTYGNVASEALKSEWGNTIGSCWRTLTPDEWAYVFKTRNASTVNSTENARYAKAYLFGTKHGVILFPDSYTHPDGVDAPTGINSTNDVSWYANRYSADDWAKMEAAGCVFLPAAGYRSGASVSDAGSYGYYWSSSSITTNYAYRVYFNYGSMTPTNYNYRSYGCSVRLVRQVE